MTEQEQRNRIDMKQAVDIAFGAIQQLYPSYTLEDLLLEEVYLGLMNENEWEVTLGFARPYSTERPGTLSNVLPQAKPRIYKRFFIDAESGDLKGMLDGRIEAD
jgi:hypothetical protein